MLKNRTDTDVRIQRDSIDPSSGIAVGCELLQSNLCEECLLARVG